jgi:hypothetical protein
VGAAAPNPLAAGSGNAAHTLLEHTMTFTVS